MKRGATREEIILATQGLIARNGIRAVRVDEIARLLGISKRTLYELFEDKNDLLNACLDAMNRQQQRRIAAYRRQRGGNRLLRTLRLTYAYIEGMFTVDSRFLTDIRRKVIFADSIDEHRAFWQKELRHYLETCREEGFLLPEIDAAALADQVMNTLLELRIDRAATCEELRLFSRTLLRGAATRKGIELIDSRPQHLC